jgi:carbonyl reductase 1
MPRTALITGANQGLGFAVAEGLARRLAPDDVVVLTGRDSERVRGAVQRVKNAVAQVRGRQLDVTDAGAVDALAAELAGVDLVVSNAAARMHPDRAPADEIDAVSEVNNLGAVRILRSFRPILRPGGRLLVVASSFGTLGHLPAPLRPRFARIRSLEDVEAVVAGWRADIKAGGDRAAAWPGWLNVPSKVAQVAAIRAVAAPRRPDDLRDGTLVAAVCPGLIDTDASRPWFRDMSAAQSPSQAAEALLELLLSPDTDPAFHGELVRFGEVLPWRDEVRPEATAGARVRHGAT